MFFQIKNLSLHLFSILAALLITACTTVRTTSSGLVGVDREQSMAVSAQSLNNEASSSYRSVLQTASNKKLLNQNASQVVRVRSISSRIIAVTGSFRPDAPSWQWEVNVVTSQDINAWCMPGGKIVVYTGLLEKIKPTDDELAQVIAHEIAHALREHGREKASQSAGVNMAATIGGVLLGALTGVNSGLGQSLISGAGDLAFMRPNSRVMESEADQIGIELAARAGYDPNAAVTLWEKMLKQTQGESPEWLSTHPASERRIADLRELAKKVYPLYLNAKKPTRGL